MSEIRAIMGDCLDVMPTLDAGSVSLIVSDPPYHRVKDCEWDRQWATDADYLDWIGRLCGEWRRVLKGNGSLYVFASPEMADRVSCRMRDAFTVLNRITWRKEAGWAKRQCKEEMRSWWPASEAIIFAEQVGSDSTAMGAAGWEAKCDEVRGFVFGSLLQYILAEFSESGLSRREVDEYFETANVSQYWLQVRGFIIPTAEKWAGLRAIRPGHFRREYEDLRREYEDLRRPFSVDDSCQYTDVWDFPTVPAAPGKHPCAKPLAMIEHIVRASSRPGDLVLDPFTGSGVTGEACRRLGRPCILIERDPHWFARLGRPHMTGPAPSRKPRKAEEFPLFAETTP